MSILDQSLRNADLIDFQKRLTMVGNSMDTGNKVYQIVRLLPNFLLTLVTKSSDALTPAMYFYHYINVKYIFSINSDSVMNLF